MPLHSIVWPHSTGRDGHKNEAPTHLTSHIWEQLLPRTHITASLSRPPGLCICWGLFWDVRCLLKWEPLYLILLWSRRCSNVSFGHPSLVSLLKWSWGCEGTLVPWSLEQLHVLAQGMKLLWCSFCFVLGCFPWQPNQLWHTLLWGGLQIMCFTFGHQEGWDTTTSRDLLMQQGRKKCYQKGWFWTRSEIR